MAGISVKIPLHTNEEDGHYALNKTFLEAAKQNFKNLLLTNPGEKIMDPAFGIGVKGLLFEKDTDQVRGDIISRIHQQVETYIPHIVIEEISIAGPENSVDIAPNSLRMLIRYRILPLNQSDLLDINIE